MALLRSHIKAQQTHFILHSISYFRMPAQLILVALAVLSLLCLTVGGTESEEQLRLATNQFERNQECFNAFDKMRRVASGAAYPAVSGSDMQTLCHGECGEIGSRIYNTIASPEILYACLCVCCYLN